MKEQDISSLEHTKWRCMYHVVFAPKYRRLAIYGEIKADIGQILRKLCEQKGVEIVEAEACPDHIHMLLKIPPKYSVSQIMGYLKGTSSLMIFDRHANLKYKETLINSKLEIIASNISNLQQIWYNKRVKSNEMRPTNVESVHVQRYGIF